MKILFVSGGLPPKRSGGLPAYLSELMDGLRQRGHDVYYLDTFCRTRRPWVTLRPQAGNNRHFELFNAGAIPDIGDGTREPMRQVKPTRRTQKLVIELAGAIAPEVIHIHEFFGLPSRLVSELARRHRVVIFTAHDYQTLCPTIQLFHQGNYNCDLPADDLDCDVCCSRAKPFSYYAALALLPQTVFSRIGPRLLAVLNLLTVRQFRRPRFVRRRKEFVAALNSLTAVLCISDVQHRVFSAAGVSEGVLRRVDLTRQTFVQIGVPEKAPVEGRPLRFLACNVYSVHKGSDVIAREFEILRQRGVPVELHVYGYASPPIDNPLIHFKGEYTPGGLDEVCRQCDAGIIPSEWRETYGYVGGEMMTRGLPVFVSGVGAMKEYVDHGRDGLVFDPAVPGALADCVERFVTDRDFRRGLLDGVRNSRDKFQRFETHVAETESLYNVLRKT